MSVLEHWKVAPEELDDILLERPSLRGFLFGYVAEYKLRKLWFSGPAFTDVRRPNNHDRARKCDLAFTYKGAPITVEVKSLQATSIRRDGERLIGKFQCDASDRRKVTLPNGDSLQTTCLVVGEFDLLAVNLFEFNHQWRFAFAKNSDLPRSKYPGYSPEQRQYLLATLMEISWPIAPPFELEPYRLLDEIASEKRRDG